MPFPREAAIRRVLDAHGVRARIGHVPRPIACGPAGAAESLERWRPHTTPGLTRYAVDQLSDSVVLDVSRARSRGWTPRQTLATCAPAG
ncbi:hypothetical protein [Streptomyces sp. NPDC049040]|uniref:hypothetical protein n=1 Tax=Streptomyces sp. NPDC049040 TaxID=3365593 RepID=UPI00372410A4